MYDDNLMGDASPSEEKAFLFVKGLIEKMELLAELEAESDAETYKLTVSGADASLLIGHRGEVLDGIQYLAALIAGNVGNKRNSPLEKPNVRSERRIMLDVEGYRDKREEALKNLAQKLAGKVAETGRPEKLEPMNSFERRIIHTTLHGSSTVVTKSAGDEPRRFVVIEPINFSSGSYDSSKKNSFKKNGAGRTRAFGNKRY